MTTPVQTTAESPAAEAALVAAVLGLLAIGAPTASLAGGLARLLRVRRTAAAAAVTVIGYRPGDQPTTFTPASPRSTAPPQPSPVAPEPPVTSADTAQRITIRAEQSYRAAFLTRSARRIEDAINQGTAPQVAVDREKRLWQLHVDAYQRRSIVAKRVDVAAAEHGLVLGWHAVLDARTSKECRAAHGNNFRADQPPALGYPGATHPRCRCEPGAPWPGGGWVDYTPGAQGGSGFERSAASG